MKFYLMLMFVLIMQTASLAQNTLTFTNGDFQQGDSTWTECGNPLVLSNAPVGDPTNKSLYIRQVQDACQTLHGLNPGESYIIHYDYSRCWDHSVNDSIAINFEANNLIVSQQWATHPFIWSYGHFNFIADSTDVTIRISASQHWTGHGCGILLDNFVIMPNLPFPVELTDFTVTDAETVVNIGWITSSETNNDRWEIKRSSDENGLKWSTVASIKGQGTTVKPSYYTYIDRNPQPGVCYYQLKQIDTDGTYSMSHIRAISRPTVDNEVSLFPNPTSTTLTVFYTNMLDSDIILVDNLGRGVYVNIRMMEGVAYLDVKSIPNGTYHIHVISSYDNTIATKIVTFIKEQ